jgi:hypothetical protein
MRRKVLVAAVPASIILALISGCATPNQAKLNEFSTLTLQDSAVQETDQFRVEAARVGAACLKEMFRTPKVNKRFTVCWLSVTAKENGAIRFDRNRVALSAAGSRNYPVGPGRVAYLSKSSSTAMLIAAVVVPVLMPIGAPIAVSGGTAYYAAVNVTGVAASAHVAGTQASNDKRSQGTRLGSPPDAATIQPGETLAGFVFFEVPGEANTTSVIEGDIVLGEQPVAFSIGNIPEVNPKFAAKEKKNENKK